MARPDTLSELPATRDHTVIVLVSAVDRRLVPALRFVARLGCSDALALHVADDPERSRRIAADWMALGLSWLPLQIEEADGTTLEASVRDAVRRHAGAGARLTVVVPELVLTHWWHQLLHHRAGRRIAAQLQRLPGVTAVVVPVSLVPAGPR